MGLTRIHANFLTRFLWPPWHRPVNPGASLRSLYNMVFKICAERAVGMAFMELAGEIEQCGGGTESESQRWCFGFKTKKNKAVISAIKSLSHTNSPCSVSASWLLALPLPLPSPRLPCRSVFLPGQVSSLLTRNTPQIRRNGHILR